MAQTSVGICNNVNLDPEIKCVSGGDRVSSCRPGWLRQSCTILNRGSGVRTRSSPIGSAHVLVIVHRGFGKKMGFQVLLIFSFLVLLFTNIYEYIVQTMYKKQQ